jgi:hypothetical protein
MLKIGGPRLATSSGTNPPRESSRFLRGPFLR